MKHILFCLSVLIFFFMTSACSIREERIMNTEYRRLVFTAESGEVKTKTAFQADETSIWWSPKDEIAIFYGASNGSKFTATNDKETAKAEFQGELDTFTGATESGELYYFWAVYPYTSAVSSDGHSVVATLSDQQLAKAGSFAPNTNVTIAKSPGLALSFYNVCSWFRFTVNHEGVKRVVLRGNNNEDIAGEFRVTMGDDNRPGVPEVINGKKTITLEPAENESFEVGKMYYITLLPQIFQNGFTVTFQTETTVGARSIDNKATFLRSKYNTGIEFDKAVAFSGFEYNIGDIVYCDGWGVVSSVSEETGELLLMSVTELSGQNWKKSNEWCNSYGQSWKMPTRSELYKINSNFSTINAGLENAFYDPLPEGLDHFHWSSTTDNGRYVACRLGVGLWANNTNTTTSGRHARAVRWVSCFDILPEPQVAPIPIQEYDITVTFKEASWSVKNTWEEGDKIFVFFKKMRSSDSENKYLTLIHDGTGFSVLPNDIDSRELSSMSEEDRKLTAIYAPRSDAQVIIDGDEYQIRDKNGNSIVSYYLYSESDYQWNGITLTTQLTMAKYRSVIRFYIGGINDIDRYRLSILSSISAGAFDKINIRDLGRNNESGVYRPLMMGSYSENGLVFYGSGNINNDAQAGKQYIFVLYDDLESKTYVITRLASSLDVVDDSVTLPSDPENNWAELEDQQWMDMGTTHKWSFFDYGYINRVSTTDKYNLYGYLLKDGKGYTMSSLHELISNGFQNTSDTDWHELNSSCTIRSIKFDQDLYGFIVLPKSGGESFLFFPGGNQTSYWFGHPNPENTTEAEFLIPSNGNPYILVEGGRTENVSSFKDKLRCVKKEK